MKTIASRPLSLGYILIVFLLASCHLIEDGGIYGTQRVVIVYLAGDNDLSAEVQQKVDALTKGFFAMKQAEEYKLVIYTDTQSGSPRLFEVSEGHFSHNGSGWERTYEPQNSASPEVLARVVSDAVAAFPAASYGLIVFSHGTAWLPAGGLEHPSAAADSRTETRAVATDGADEMELADFAAALPMPDGQKWKFIVFENCYMGSVEVAYELKGKTEALVASAAEVVSPGMTEVYPSALKSLYRSAPDLEGFARAYFDCWNAKSGDYRSATISVIRTEDLDRLAQIACVALWNWPGPSAVELDTLQCFNRNRWHLFFDLKEVLLTANPAMRQWLEETLARVIVYQEATPCFLEHQYKGYAIRQHCGLTIYVLQTEYPLLNETYKKLKWYRDVFREVA